MEPGGKRRDRPLPARTDDARDALEMKGRRLDETIRHEVFRANRAGVERGPDLRRPKGADGDGDQARAEVAVGLE
jgi:hypothetical protein